MDSIFLFFQIAFDAIVNADKSALLYINSFHNNFFDSFMFWVSDKWVWVPMYITMIYAIIKEKKRETFFILLGIALTVFLCDRFSSGVCKPFFERFRPCQDPIIGSAVHVVCGFKCDLYGFISSHAANTFGIAVFTTMLFKNRSFNLFIWLWALLNCYSRIYMGVHYPGDILCGAISGLLFGMLSFWLYKWLLKRMPQFRYSRHTNNSRANIDFPTSDFIPFFWTFIVTIFTIAIFSSNSFFTC